VLLLFSVVVMMMMMQDEDEEDAAGEDKKNSIEYRGNGCNALEKEAGEQCMENQAREN
jgi:hypothetical protein